LFFQHACGRREVVDRRVSADRKPEGAFRIDVLMVSQKQILFTVRSLYCSAISISTAPRFPRYKRRIVQRGFSAIQMLDEFSDAA